LLAENGGVGNLTASWIKELEDGYGDIVAWRRAFHEFPELSFEEIRTPARIAELLQSFGIEVKTDIGGHGVVGLLKGTAQGNGAHIAFRADFDGLPIQDTKDVPYKSKVNGVMHACGHDGHTAALLGVARVLKKFQHEISGTVTFIFQHAEEKPPGGAISFVKEGVLENVDAIYGAHLSSVIPFGVIGSRAGIKQASADTFEVSVKGLSAHGATPEEGVDAIAIGAQIITQLQHIVSRRISAAKQAVLSIGKFQGGTAENIVADEAVFSGTVRTFDEETRQFIKEEIIHLATYIAGAHHAKADVDYQFGYPPLVNHKKETEIVQQIVERDFPTWTYEELPPGLGAEDFSYYLREVPGNFFFVGAKQENVDQPIPHHHPLFDFDEQALLNIGKVFLSIVDHYEKETRQPANSN